MPIFKTKAEKAREKAIIDRKAQLEFKARMNGVKKDFDKGIGNLEKLRKDRAQKAQMSNAQGRKADALNYAKEVRDIGKYLNKLIDMRSKVERYISKLDYIKIVAGSIGGIQAISEEISKVAASIDFSGAYVDMGIAATNFAQLEERLDGIFDEFDEMFEMEEVSGDSDDDNDFDLLMAQVDEIAPSEKTVKDKEEDADKKRLGEIDRILGE